MATLATLDPSENGPCVAKRNFLPCLWVSRLRETYTSSVASVASTLLVNVAWVVPYYHGWQVEGEWLDDWRDAVMAECDRLDRECREVRDGA